MDIDEKFFENISLNLLEELDKLGEGEVYKWEPKYLLDLYLTEGEIYQLIREIYENSLKVIVEELEKGDEFEMERVNEYSFTFLRKSKKYNQK